MKKYRLFFVTGGSAAAVKSNIFVRNFYDSLVDMGHDVYLVEFLELLAKAGIDRSNVNAEKEFLTTKILEIFRKEHDKKAFDYFFSYVHQQNVFPELFIELKKYVFTINYSTNFHQFDTLHKEIAPYIGLNTYISLPHKDAYDSVSAASYWMPMAANPNFYKNNTKKDIPILFVGSAYANRPYYIWRVLQNKLNIQVYGSAWQKRKKTETLLRDFAEPTLYYSLKGSKDKLQFLYRNQRRVIVNILNEDYPKHIHFPLSDQDMVDKMSRAKIMVNFPESRINHDFLNPEVLFGCNFRDFEAPMSGTLLVTQYSKELAYFYKEDEEVISFKNEFEMVDKLKFYNQNESAAEEIARKGYERALKDHTWQNRFRDLFKYLKESA